MSSHVKADSPFADTDSDAARALVRVVRVEPVSNNARIEGRVVDPSGAPVAHATVHPVRSGGGGGGLHMTDPKTGAFKIDKMQPGRYSITVRVDGYPTLRTADRELGAGETWDAGMLQLVTGGRIAVLLDRPLPAKAYLIVLGEDSRFLSLLSAEDGRRAVSDLLAPGRYRLAAYGGGMAASITPVEVVAGETTEYPLSVTSGVACRIVVAFPGPVSEPRDTRIEIRGAGGPVALRTSRARADRAAQIECALLPGDYVVSATADTLTAQRTLSVKAGQDPIELRLALR